MLNERTKSHTTVTWYPCFSSAVAILCRPLIIPGKKNIIMSPTWCRKTMSSLSASMWTWVRIITHSKDASLYIRNKYDKQHSIFWNDHWSAMLDICTTRKNIVQKQHALICLGQNTEILSHTLHLSYLFVLTCIHQAVTVEPTDYRWLLGERFERSLNINLPKLESFLYIFIQQWKPGNKRKMITNIQQQDTVPLA